MNTTQLDKAYHELQRVLKMLAAPSEAQLLYLATLGTLPSVDELALEFDDVYRLMPELQRMGLLSQYQVDAISYLEQKLSIINGIEQLWTSDALEYSSEWAEIRKLALVSINAIWHK